MIYGICEVDEMVWCGVVILMSCRWMSLSSSLSIVLWGVVECVIYFCSVLTDYTWTFWKFRGGCIRITDILRMCILFIWFGVIYRVFWLRYHLFLRKSSSSELNKCWNDIVCWGGNKRVDICYLIPFINARSMLAWIGVYLECDRMRLFEVRGYPVQGLLNACSK